jgi:hypothetical protein
LDPKGKTAMVGSVLTIKKNQVMENLSKRYGADKISMVVLLNQTLARRLKRKKKP